MLLRAAAGISILAALALPCSMSFFKASYHKNRRSVTPLFRFEQNGRAGFINAAGKVVIPPRFDVGWFAEEDFVEGLSPARSGENWGFIDTKGNWAVQPRYWRVEPFSEGLAAVTGQLKGYDFPAAYIDKSGKPIMEFPKGLADAGPFSEGMAAVRLNGYSGVGKVGYIDRSGSAAIPYQFALGGAFHEGLAAVVFDGRCYIEERGGGPRGTPPSVMPASSCGGVPADITVRCGEAFIDKTGKVVFRFEGVRDFSEGLAAVQENGKWGFIDPHGRFRIAPQFEAAGPYSLGLAAAKSGGKWGYVDQNGQWVIQARFTQADDFSDGLALTNEGYIDKTGSRSAVANGGTPFVLGLAHVTLGEDLFGYIDHAGKIVFRYHAQPAKPSSLPYASR
jgi:hypothetical protein